MWGLRGCSTERGLGAVDCSLDRWQDRGGEEGIFFNQDKFRTAYKLLRIEKVDFFNIHKNVNF